MTMKFIHLTALLALLSFGAAGAQVVVSETAPRSKSSFALAAGSARADICYDADDDLVIAKVAGLFAEDVNMVTGRKPRVVTEPTRGNMAVIVGTIGKSDYIKQLAEKGKIDISPLEGQWERYLVQIVDNPFPGVRKGLVIAGSDRRGAAYGLFSISEAIGVSPWYWWADVPVDQKKAVYISGEPFVSKTPSVKYRGIFLNDEDWGLTPWAGKTFEPEVGNIGPRTYAKIFEVMLRLKANYLCPAMHECSFAFNEVPENKMVADTFAIVMGSHHHEPLLFNTAREWRGMGPWNYEQNKDKMLEVLRKRVTENRQYENVYTLALRGAVDAAMGGGDKMEDKVKLLGDAMMDQRNILDELIDQPVESIPQAFTPYKEVLEIYLNGLEIPEDVIIVWPDDNFGYIKQLSSPTEQKRSGGSGVYYHVSYLGKPHSYLWFSTTPTMLMYEELRKAYDTGADRMWLINCGDLKAAEMQVAFAMDMAYDIEQFNVNNVADYPARWLAGFFGEQYYPALRDIYRSYIDMAFPRKPEYMGWGYHWNRYNHNREQLTDTEFSFMNYNEVGDRLAEYTRIANIATELLGSVGEEHYPAFFELVYYPIKGAELMNRMTLGGHRNRWYARQGRAATNAVKEEVQSCFDSLHLITDQYNGLLDGKWNHMMSMRQNYDGISSYYLLPELRDYTPATGPKMALSVEQEDVTGTRSFHALPAFNKFQPKSFWFDVYNKGTGSIVWNAKPSADWIVLDKSSGSTPLEERVMVSVDWSKAPVGEDVLGHIDLDAQGGETKRILVSLFNPASPSVEELKGLYVQDNGYVSIPGAGYHRARENDHIKMTVLDGIGFEGEALQLGNPVAPLQNFRDSNRVPHVEYDFFTFDAGMVDVYTYVLPTFPLHSERDFRLSENTNSTTKYSIQIDHGAIMTPSSSTLEYDQIWYESVPRNCRINKTSLWVDKPGKHTLQIRVGDPGIVVQKIVIDLGGMKRSYMGPQPTMVK